MNTLNEFLKHAKFEQDLYSIFERSYQLSLDSKEFNCTYHQLGISSFTTVIRQSKEHIHSKKPSNNRLYPISTQISVLQWDSLR